MSELGETRWGEKMADFDTYDYWKEEAQSLQSRLSAEHKELVEEKNIRKSNQDRLLRTDDALKRAEGALRQIAESNHQDTCEGNYGAPLSECTCHVGIAHRVVTPDSK